MEQLGKRIKAARLSKGETQENMAYQLGIGQSNYSELENGRRRITPDRLIQISEILQLEVEQIINYPLPNNAAEELHAGLAQNQKKQGLMAMISELEKAGAEIYNLKEENARLNKQVMELQNKIIALLEAKK